MEGSVLGVYTLGAELGSGGMGTVYRATGPEGTVAVKVVHPHLLETPGFFKRFLREAEIGRRVEHANVVRTLDCDQVVTGGRANSFLVMECVEGQTLRELLRELERVPEELCRHICREVAKGLAAIHEVGAIHRDIKPENVLITPEHEVKLMDLGVARLADEALRLSQTGAFVGSLQYASPEQFQGGGRDTDRRADLHALGLVLYELATGLCAYDGGDVPKVIHRILHEEPRRLGDVNGQVSPFFEQIVHTLIAKDPAARFQTALDVVRILDEGEDGQWWRETARELRRQTHKPLRRIRLPRETGVYGRDAEFGTLTSLFASARGGHGQVVLIEGEPGIGKTRLVDEFVERQRRTGEDIHFLFAAYPPGGAATASGAFSTAYREQVGDDGAATYLTSTPLLIPAFDALLRGDATPPGAEPLRKQSLHACFVNLTRGLAAEQPTVILIDDLHFAPAEGLALFAALAAAVADDRVLLIGTARPSLPAEWTSALTRLEHTTHMELARLGPKDMGALLTESFRSQGLAERLSFEIGAKSDGNPFFVFEIVRGMREDSVIKRADDGSWISTGRIDRIQIPSSVLDLVHGRVADLDDDDKDLLEVASCWGYEFDPAHVAEAAGVPIVAALKRFGRIEKTHRLVRAAGRMLVFDHHQVQESLYAGILEQLREHYHAELAAILESRSAGFGDDPESWPGALCVELTQHFLKGAQPKRAARYVSRAIEHLSAGHLGAEAIELAEQALAAPGLLTGMHRAGVLHNTGLRMDLEGRFQDQLECATEALKISLDEGDLAYAARMTAAVSRARVMLSQPHAAEGLLREGIEYGRQSGDVAAEGTVWDGLAIVLRNLGRYEESLAASERAMELQTEAGNARELTRVHGHISLTMSDLGRVMEARHHLEQQLRLAQEREQLLFEANAVINLGGWYFRRGQFDEARAHADRYLELCRQVGDRMGEVHASAGLSALMEAQGRLADGLAQAERSIALSREMAFEAGLRLASQNKASVCVLLGEFDTARELCQKALMMVHSSGDPRMIQFNRARLAQIDAEQGAVREAIAKHEDILECRREIGDPQTIAMSQIEIATQREFLGDVDGARAALDEARELAKGAGFEEERILSSALAACLPGGDASEPLAHLAEFSDRLGVLTRMRVRFMLWRATDDEAHLLEAHNLLEFVVAHAPAQFRNSMLANVRLYGEIAAAMAARS